MKSWIVLAALAMATTGCVSTEGLQILSPVMNEVHFTGDYVPANEVDQAPEVVDQIPAEFPAVMAKAHADGRAQVALLVDLKGKPMQVQLEQATHPLFGEAAVAAVKQWTFKPAMKAGKPVVSPTTVSLDFRRENPVADTER